MGQSSRGEPQSSPATKIHIDGWHRLARENCGCGSPALHFKLTRGISINCYQVPYGLVLVLVWLCVRVCLIIRWSILRCILSCPSKALLPVLPSPNQTASFWEANNPDRYGRRAPGSQDAEATKRSSSSPVPIPTLSIQWIAITNMG